jgi:two-component system sensor histidine kinase ChvG
MAIETDSRRPLHGALAHARDGAARLQQLLSGLLSRAQAVQVPSSLSSSMQRLRAAAPYRFFTRTLARRIFVSNLLGLFVLLGGILWLSHHNAWLISAKRESLRIQGEIIAAAIAADPRIERDRIAFDPERLPEMEAPRAPYRDDRFAAYELSLRPDHVGPVLRRLIQPAEHTTRARIYDRDGELVVDTLPRLPKKVRPVATQADEAVERVRVKNFWTRLASWFDGSDLPVYREIGVANGTYYREVQQALTGQFPLPMLLLTDEGKLIVSLAVPIQRRNNTVGALLLSTRPGEIDDILAAERRIIYTLAVMALLATLMASLLLARTIAGPVHRLSGAADNVSRSINARADLPDYGDRRDEVGQLAVAFRRMTGALYRRIEASEKFAADVAHELKNPLAAAQATTESLSYAKTPEQRNQIVAEVRGELKRLNRLITDVSNASRLDAELARQISAPVDLTSVLSGIVDVFRDLGSASQVRINLDIEPGAAASGDLVVRGHDGRLGQVLTNLIDNAVSFSPEGAAITVAARRIGSEVELSVVDEGPGIPEDNLEKVFERFYSDRPESDRTKGKNSGLGLSISREIVAAHGGRIWAENLQVPVRFGRDNGRIAGARFVVRLPAHQQSATRGQLGLGWRQ